MSAVPSGSASRRFCQERECSSRELNAIRRSSSAGAVHGKVHCVDSATAREKSGPQQHNPSSFVATSRFARHNAGSDLSVEAMSVVLSRPQRSGHLLAALLAIVVVAGGLVLSPHVTAVFAATSSSGCGSKALPARIRSRRRSTVTNAWSSSTSPRTTRQRNQLP